MYLKVAGVERNQKFVLSKLYSISGILIVIVLSHPLSVLPLLGSTESLKCC